MWSVIDSLIYSWQKKYWNWLWFLIPILGWFAFLGYLVKIVNSVMHNKETLMPKFGSFWNEFLMGVEYSIILLVWLFVISLASMVPILGWLISLLLAIWAVGAFLSFAERMKFDAGFNFVKAAVYSYGHFWQFLIWAFNVFILKIFEWAIVIILLALFFGLGLLGSFCVLCKNLFFGSIFQNHFMNVFLGTVNSFSGYSVSLLILFAIIISFVAFYFTYALTFVMGRYGQKVLRENNTFKDVIYEVKKSSEAIAKKQNVENKKTTVPKRAKKSATKKTTTKKATKKTTTKSNK